MYRLRVESNRRERAPRKYPQVSIHGDLQMRCSSLGESNSWTFGSPTVRCLTGRLKSYTSCRKCTGASKTSRRLAKSCCAGRRRRLALSGETEYLQDPGAVVRPDTPTIGQNVRRRLLNINVHRPSSVSRVDVSSRSRSFRR